MSTEQPDRPSPPASAATAERPYVVLKRGLFWRPEDKGYTAKIEEAGRYTKEEAESRCHGGEQPVTMALASSFQTQESLQAEVDALRLALAASRDEAEKAKADSERLDWLIEHYGIMIWASCSRDFLKPPIGQMTHREIIDAARADAARKERA